MTRPVRKTVVLISAGFAIALDTGVFDELAIRAALSDVAVDAVLVEPVASPSSRRLVPANIISNRRSLMRRLTELAGAALGTAYSAVGGSQEPFERLMTTSTRYRLDVRPAAAGASDVAAKVAVAVAGSRAQREGPPLLRAAGAARRGGVRHTPTRGLAGPWAGRCPMASAWRSTPPATWPRCLATPRCC